MKHLPPHQGWNKYPTNSKHYYQNEPRTVFNFHWNIYDNWWRQTYSKTILKTEESSNSVAFYFFLTVIHSKYYITIHFICETKTKVTKNIPYPYWIRWTYIFSMPLCSLLLKKNSAHDPICSIWVENSNSLDSFYKMCLEESLPNSLTSEEVRQPWTAQKEVIALQELKMNVNPNLSYIYGVLPPEHMF